MSSISSPSTQPRFDARELLAAAPVNADSLFKLLGQSALVGDGRTLLISIAAIQAALGDKWEGRRGQVHDFIDRHLGKHLSAEDICQRISETHYLIATPGKSQILAQTICYRVLKDVLSHFLGEIAPANILIQQVVDLSADQVTVRPCSIAELDKAEASVSRQRPRAEPVSRLSDLVAWPLRTTDGQNVRVSFAVDPVLDLKAWAVAGHRIESRIVKVPSGEELAGAERRKLLPPDFQRIDLAALERGLSRLSGLETSDRPCLVLELSFASLSNGRARAALLDRMRDVQAVTSHSVVCELVDMEEGVPPSRVTELMSLVRTFFRTVSVQVEPSAAMIATAIAANVSVISVRGSSLGSSHEQIVQGLHRFAGLAKRHGTVLTVTNLPERSLLVDAMAEGFSYATLRTPVTRV